MMLQYACDFCGKVKNGKQSWLLGFAAESVGPSSAHRTVSLAAAWDEGRAVDPLAVHFCSERCKEKYIKSLFSREPQEGEIVEEETVELLPGARRRTLRKRTQSKQAGGRKRKRAA